MKELLNFFKHKPKNKIPEWMKKDFQKTVKQAMEDEKNGKPWPKRYLIA